MATPTWTELGGYLATWYQGAISSLQLIRAIVDMARDIVNPHLSQWYWSQHPHWDQNGYQEPV